MLVLRDDMPRSLHSCMNLIDDTLGHLCEARNDELARRAGELHARLHYGRTDEIIRQGLHEYLMDFLERVSDLGDEISRRFLAPVHRTVCCSAKIGGLTQLRCSTDDRSCGDGARRRDDLLLRTRAPTPGLPVARFSKMRLFARPHERVVVMLSSGNLSLTQNAVNVLELRNREGDAAPNVMNAKSMFDVARMLGDAVREVRVCDAGYLEQHNIDASANFIVGGQIDGETRQLFHVYGEGNFIEATSETCYFQIGESKDGKPVIDRVISRGHVAGRRHQVHAGVVRLDDALQHLGGPADRPARLRGRRARSRDAPAVGRGRPVFPDGAHAMGRRTAACVRAAPRSRLDVYRFPGGARFALTHRTSHARSTGRSRSHHRSAFSAAPRCMPPRAHSAARMRRPIRNSRRRQRHDRCLQRCVRRVDRRASASAAADGTSGKLAGPASGECTVVRPHAFRAESRRASCISAASARRCFRGRSRAAKVARSSCGSRIPTPSARRRKPSRRSSTRWHGSASRTTRAVSTRCSGWTGTAR